MEALPKNKKHSDAAKAPWQLYNLKADRTQQVDLLRNTLSVFPN